MEHAKVDADLLFLFRTIHGIHGVNLNTIGMLLSPNNERNTCCRLLQPRPITNSVGNLFSSDQLAFGTRSLIVGLLGFLLSVFILPLSPVQVRGQVTGRAIIYIILDNLPGVRLGG